MRNNLVVALAISATMLVLTVFLTSQDIRNLAAVAVVSVCLVGFVLWALESDDKPDHS